MTDPTQTSVETLPRREALDLLQRHGFVGRGPGVVAYRSIRPDDATELQAFHRRLSDDTVRNRFFGVHRELSAKEAQRFTSLPAGETAVVGTVNDGIIAVGRSIHLGGGDRAEVAFVVEDDYQHRGIGTTLLVLLARFAWTDGVRHFVADTFTSNRSMLDVFMHSPRAVTVLSTRRDGSVAHLVMRVTEPPGLQVRADDARGKV
jgi:GNAT superfamily N-acetyltransferase